jgi:hypothetical protein
MQSVPIIRRKSAQFPVALSRSYAEDLASIRSPGSHVESDGDPGTELCVALSGIMPDIAGENVDPSAHFVKARRENSNLVSYIVGKSPIEISCSLSR